MHALFAETTCGNIVDPSLKGNEYPPPPFRPGYRQYKPGRWASPFDNRKGTLYFKGRDLTSFNQMQTKDKMGHFLYFLEENTVFRKKEIKAMISHADLEGPEL
jgi:hypothetical protein